MEWTGGNRAFVTTHWSVVLAARDDSLESLDAMDRLCRAYWYPLYAFVRRGGFSSHEAEDLVQGFFCFVIEKTALTQVSPEKGRFRSFLLRAIRNYVSKVRERDGAQKRGGGQKVVSIDCQSFEERYLLEPARGLS